MSKMYKSLKHLAIDDIKMTKHRRSWYKNRLRKLVASCPHLESDSVSISPITDSIVQAMNNCNAQLKYITLFNYPLDQIYSLNCSYQGDSI